MGQRRAAAQLRMSKFIATERGVLQNSGESLIISICRSRRLIKIDAEVHRLPSLDGKKEKQK